MDQGDLLDDRSWTAWNEFKICGGTLGTKYRQENEDGSVSGGPMYYLRDGLAKQGKAQLGKILAVLFAIACIGGSFGGGGMVQVNQATKQLIEVTGGEQSFLAGQSWMFGVVMAILQV